MKRLTEQFEEILFPLFTDAGGYGVNPYIKELIEAVKKRDEYIIEEDEPLGEWMSGIQNGELENELRKIQRMSAEESL